MENGRGPQEYDLIMAFYHILSHNATMKKREKQNVRGTVFRSAAFPLTGEKIS